MMHDGDRWYKFHCAIANFIEIIFNIIFLCFSFTFINELFIQQRVHDKSLF